MKRLPKTGEVARVTAMSTASPTENRPSRQPRVSASRGCFGPVIGGAVTSAGRSGDRPGLISPAAWFESTPRYHGRHKPEAADPGHASRPTGVGGASLRMAALFDQTFTTARRETDDSTPFPRASSGPTSGHFFAAQPSEVSGA